MYSITRRKYLPGRNWLVGDNMELIMSGYDVSRILFVIYIRLWHKPSIKIESLTMEWHWIFKEERQSWTLGQCFNINWTLKVK